MGKNEEAVIAFDKAIEINPNYAVAWFKKGNALYNLNRYDAAILAFDNAIEINPSYADAWNNKGTVLLKLGKYEEAAMAYDKAIEINPMGADAWYNKGIALQILNRYDEAIAAFNKALELNPNKIEALVNKLNAIQNLESQDREIRINVYVEPRTGQIISQLELNIESLLGTNSIDPKPDSIELNYVFEGINRNYTVYLFNNSYYIGKPIKVDLMQRGDFPFEDYNTTIFKSTNYPNSTNKNMTIESWGQTRVLNFVYEENKIEIIMERANKQVSRGLYIIGVLIIISYLLFYWKSPYNPDMFAVFNSFSFLFFVAFVIAGVREYLLSTWGILFVGLIFVFFVIFVYKRINSRKQDNTSELKKELKILKADMKEMLKQNEEKITEMKEMLNAELMHDYEGLKPK